MVIVFAIPGLDFDLAVRRTMTQPHGSCSVLLIHTRPRRSFMLLRLKHQLWPDILVEISFTQRLQLHGRLFQCQALLVRILRYFGRHIVANDRIEASDQHQTANNNVLAHSLTDSTVLAENNKGRLTSHAEVYQFVSHRPEALQ